MKTFNLFEKLWEHGRTLRRVGLVLVMCLITIPQAWAWEAVYLNGDFTGGNWGDSGNGSSTYHINYSLSDGHYFYPFYSSGGDKYWRLYHTRGWLLSPASDNYVLNVSSNAYQVKGNGKKNFKSNVNAGVTSIHINQKLSGTVNGTNNEPAVWMERPTIYIWHNWNGNTSGWGDNGGSGQKAMTDHGDGTYTYDGLYSGSGTGTNVGIQGSAAIKKYFANADATIQGSPSARDKCRFTWNSNGYKGYDGETSNRGTLTITKLVTITFDANGATKGSVPSSQEVLYNTASTLSRNSGNLEKVGYKFIGWNTSSGGGSATRYTAGGSITITSNTKLYAEWQAADTWYLKGGDSSSEDGTDALGDWKTKNYFSFSAEHSFAWSVELLGDKAYKFKLCKNNNGTETWYGNSWYIDATTDPSSLADSDWSFTTDGGDCTLNTGKAGTYVFTIDGTASNPRLRVYYPDDAAKVFLTKNKYIYINSTSGKEWNGGSYTARFWFKATVEDVHTSNIECEYDNALDVDYMYYTKVPDNDYIDRLQLLRLDPSDLHEWNKASLKYAFKRDNNKQNCLVFPTAGGDWSNNPSWGTYCPPMSSASMQLADGTVTYGGDGGSSTPYLVATSSSIYVEATSVSKLDDDNMTPYYQFKKAGSNDGEESSTATHTYTASGTNNTKQAMTVVARNYYYTTAAFYGTASPASDAIYYESRTPYSVTPSLTNMTVSAGRTGSAAVVSGVDYVATLAADDGYSIPAAITVTRGETDITANCTWDHESGTLTIPAAQVTGNITITAAGVSCPTGGTVYSFVAKKESSEFKIQGTPIDITNNSSLITSISGGILEAYSATNGDVRRNGSSKGLQLNADAGYLILKLNCPLEAGDVVKWTTTNATLYLCTTTTYDSDTDLACASGTSEAEITSAMVGKKVLYIKRSGSALRIEDFKITRPCTITLDAGDGTCSESSLTCVDGHQVVLPHATYTGYRFLGWYEDPDDDTPQDNYYTGGGSNITLYAQYDDCLDEGTIFSLALDGDRKPTAAVKVPAGETMDLLRYADIEGGAAFAGNSAGSGNYGGVSSTPTIVMENNAYVKIELDCPLASGDVITFVGITNSSYTWVSNSSTRPGSAPDTKVNSTNNTITCDGSNLTGKTFYIYYGASSAFTGITITRPAPVSTFDVTIASNNTDYGDVDVKSLNDVESGTTISTSDNELTIGETVITATPETSDAQYTYTFIGWTDDEGEDLPSTVTGDLSILANFDRVTNSYTITWKNYDGTTLETDASVAYGATPSYNGSTPTKASTAEYDYSFNAWDPAITSVTGAATYTATFTETARNYTLAWDKNGDGDDLSGSYTSGTTAYGTTLIAPNTPTWDGHRFDGWNTKANGSGDAYTGTMPAADTKYYAQWTVLHDVTITATNVTKSTGAATAAEGENYVATFSTVTGYDLPTSVAVKIGDDDAVLITDYTWSAGTLTVLAASVTDDITITVIGDPQTYTISYKDKGGSDYSGSNLASLPSSHTYGTATDFVNGVKANYTFDGWFTDSGCESSAGSSIGATAITSNTTYYAKWTAKTAPTQYAVTIDAATVCSGSTTNIKMAESQSGVSYQLYKGEDKVDEAKAGGSALTWSSISATGTYKVMAVENATYASREMSNTVTLANYDAVSIKTNPTAAIAATVGEGVAMSVVLNTGTFNNATYTWQTCTDATPTSASDITSGSQYANYNTATMTFTPTSAGTYYFRCKVTDDCENEVYSSVATVTATDGPCFTMTANTSAKSNGSLSHNESIAEGSDNCSDLDGGTAKYADVDGSASMEVTADKGWKFNRDKDQIIVTLSAGYSLQEGSIITLSGYANSSGNGIQINGKTVYTKPSTSGAFADVTYTVLSTDAVLKGANELVIKRVSGGVYLSSISFSGCDYCVPITPTLTYNKTTFWLDEETDSLWCSPTLDKAGSTGTVTYSSSDPSIVWVGTYGSIFAEKRGTATITASIAADGTHCASEATCKIIVKSIECGNSVVAEAVLNGTSSTSSLIGGTLVAANLKSVTAPNYKLNSNGAKFGITISGSFSVGDSIIFGGKMDGNPTSTSFWVFPNDTATTAVSAIYTATLAASDSIDAKFVVTEGMLSALNSSKKVCIVRQSAINQNPHMKFVRIKRYTCPDILVFNDYKNNGSWNDAGNWVGKAGQGTGLPKDTDRVYIKKSVTVDATTAVAGRVHVTNGAVMTVEKSVTMGKIDVETGSTLHVAKDGESAVTLSLKTLHLVGGFGTVNDETKYDMPRVYIDPASTIEKTNDVVNFDIAVNNRSYYPFALPFDVPLVTYGTNAVDYANSYFAYYSNYGLPAGQYAIKTYNGQKRANSGSSSANWEQVSVGTTLKAGKGYALCAMPADASGYNEAYAVIRFPMVVDGAWTIKGEQGSVEIDDETVTKNVIPVTAYKKEGTGEGTGDKTPKKNIGWNLLGVPFMSCYQTSADMYSGVGAAAIIQGKIDYETNQWDDKDEVRYVTIPNSDFTEYAQYNIVDDDTKLLPGWCFFVQIETSGNLTFLSAKEAQDSDLPYAAPRREQANMPTLKTGIILSGNDASDKTTILVSDKYSAAEYEINADLEKMFGEDSYTLATYSLSGSTRLAFNAMSNADAANIIPIGYRAPADGEYTFSINPRYAENSAFESVNLIDYETGIVTDLMSYSYTFSTERTQNDARFALNATKRQDTTTDIENGASEANGVRKLIINDKLYIILDGKMYDATGKAVK